MVYECYLMEQWEQLKKKSADLQLPGSKSIELDSNKSDLDENDQKPFDVVKTEPNFEDKYPGLQRFAVKVTRDDD